MNRNNQRFNANTIHESIFRYLVTTSIRGDGITGVLLVNLLIDILFIQYKVVIVTLYISQEWMEQFYDFCGFGLFSFEIE